MRHIVSIAVLFAVLLLVPCTFRSAGQTTMNGDVPLQEQQKELQGKKEPEAPVGKTEKLKASKITSRMRGLRGMRPQFGLPERIERPVHPTNALCDLFYGELITCEDGVWTSMNPELEIPNWVAWDIDLASLSSRKDAFSPKMKPEKMMFRKETLNAVLEECVRWAAEKPLSPSTIVCGPLVQAAETAKGKDAIPYEYFVVICRKTSNALGWKSIGFLIPNKDSATEGAYKYSDSVNVIEHKSGYDFFRTLPDALEELVEGMTTYELFCSFVEDESYRDDPSEREDDYLDAMNDYFDDFRER